MSRSTFKPVAIALAAFLLLGGTLGLLTWHLLRGEREGLEAAAQMDHENDLRLAMWQLDSTGMTILLDGAAELETGRFVIGADGRVANATAGLEKFFAANPEVALAFIKPRELGQANLWQNDLGALNYYNDSNYSSAKAEEYARPSKGKGSQIADQRKFSKGKRSAVFNGQYEENVVREKLQDLNEGVDPPPAPTTAAVFGPSWQEGRLFVTRSRSDGAIEGREVDVGELQKQLLEPILATLDAAELVPVYSPEEFYSLAMVTWPFRLLDQGAGDISPPGWTTLRIGLLIGWVAAIAGAAMVVTLVFGLWKLSERRAAFVSSVTHELRTPLTTFQLYTDLLEGGMVPEEKRVEYLAAMRSEAGRLHRLVENVLAYARIERGSARSHVEEIGVGELLERVEPHLRARTAQSGAELVIDANLAKVRLRTDVTGVEQVLFNLVDNACKYGMTRSKRVELQVCEGDGEVAFTVSDDGDGIADRERRKLFRAFHKSAKDAAEKRTPGVGLGLSLSRRIAQHLGGELTLEPSEQGARFRLTLPVTD